MASNHYMTLSNPRTFLNFFFWDSNARNSAEKTLGILSIAKVLVLQLERFQGL